MVFNRGLYFHQFVAAVVAEFLFYGLVHVSCQTNHTTLLPTEETGIGLPQSVLLTLISVVGSLLGLVCLGIVALLCFYFTRNRKNNSSLQDDRNKTGEELPTRVLHTKPPVIGSSVHDVSKVVELVKSKDDKTDMAGAPERAFATLVDRPVLNPEVQRIDVDDNTTVEETKVMYMANYQRRFTDVTGDDDATLAIYGPTSEEPVFGSPVNTYNPDGT